MINFDSILKTFLLFHISCTSFIFAENPCTIPTTPTENLDDWMTLHEGFVEGAHYNTENHVVFIGDSIVRRMNFSTLWDEKISTLHSMNFGVGGDMVEWVLWRISNGEFDFITKMDAAVIFVGTNNRDNTAEEIFEGIEKLVEVTTSKLGTDAAIVLPTMLPRGQYPNSDRDRLQGINNYLLRRYPGDPTDNVYVVRIDEGIVGDDGTISEEDMDDFLHPTDSGYTKIFTPVYDKLVEILNKKSVKTNV